MKAIQTFGTLCHVSACMFIAYLADKAGYHDFLDNVGIALIPVTLLMIASEIRRYEA